MIDIEKVKRLEEMITKKLDVHLKKTFDIEERLKDNADIALEFSNYLFRIKKVYYELRMNCDKLYGELYKKNKFNSTLLLKTKSDIDAFIDTDESYIKLKSEVDYVINLVNLIQNVVDIYKNREASERMLYKGINQID